MGPLPTTDATQVTAPCVLGLASVSVDRGGVRLLDEVSLEVETGGVVLCTGPNGAGKTTLLRLLAGLVRPTTGSVTGPDGRVDLLGHESALHPDLTLAENLGVVAHLVGASPGACRAALGHVGLGGAADRRAARCSAGMRRRADFARLRLTRPDVLLLDEPDLALDDDARLLVADAISDTVGRGGAVVVATHTPERLAHMATTRWHVRDGAVAM